MVDTAVLILNWNGGADTAVCIGSVLQLPDVTVFVLDNASSDDSVAGILSLAADAGVDTRQFPLADIGSLNSARAKLNIIYSPENLGFSRGINRMLEQVLQDKNIRYAWLLNNDAIAAPGALTALKRTIESGRDITFAGSVILDYWQRDLVQCCGVDYYRFFGVGKLLLKDRKWTEVGKHELDSLEPVFQHGASLLVKTSCVGRIGLMDEQFFLYAEEHDWQVSALEKGYGNRLATDSIVYHKGSVSTIDKKHLFYYYYNTSSVYFSRKHYNIVVNLIASVLLGGVTAIRARFNPKALWWGIRGIIHGWNKQLK